jgi:glutamyl-tRNA synthetase
VDDIAMQVTHVIRGEDHLSNTSKHTELFKAFGAPLPTYAHIPLILKQNGPGKMSKRDQGALVEEYRERGFIPEALVNFLCLLGWSPKGDREKLPLAEIVSLFDLPGINQSNARFDEKKLAHMNMVYLHEMPPERCFAFARDFLKARNFFPGGLPDESYLRDVIVLCQPKVRSIEDLPGFIGYFFGEDYAIDAKAREKVFLKGDPKARLGELLAVLPSADFSSDATLEALVHGLAATHAAGTGDYIHPARLAVSGTAVGPSFYGLLRVLGRERVDARIRRFLASA